MKIDTIGVCEFSLPCWGPIAMELAHKAGFSGIQLADAGGVNAGYPFQHAVVRAAYLEAAQRFQLTLQAMHLHSLFHSHLIDDPAESTRGEEARRCIRLGVEACTEMCIPVIMITVTNVASQEQYDNVRDALTYALALCRDHGLRLAVETDFPPARFHRLREQVGEDLRLCFDTMNPTVYGIGKPAELIHAYGLDIIDHFHVKDCCRNVRGYFTKYTTPMRLIGEGESGFADCAQVIQASGYDGWFLSETFYFDPAFAGRDLVELASRDAACLRDAFSARP